MRVVSQIFIKIMMKNQFLDGENRLTVEKRTVTHLLNSICFKLAYMLPKN